MIRQRKAQYAEINEKVANNRIAADQLDKTYLSKFKKILSSKKIFLVQRAEMRFHREMIKGMNRSKGRRKRFEKEIMMKNRALCFVQTDALFR